MFYDNKINNSRYVKNARDAHIAFGANLALVSIQTKDVLFFCCGNSAADISKSHRGCDQIMRVGFTFLDLFPDITDRISSI